jgi:hypothetical protein
MKRMACNNSRWKTANQSKTEGCVEKYNILLLLLLLLLTGSCIDGESYVVVAQTIESDFEIGNILKDTSVTEEKKRWIYRQSKNYVRGFQRSDILHLVLRYCVTAGVCKCAKIQETMPCAQQ